jgi:hypothetical protein
VGWTSVCVRSYRSAIDFKVGEDVVNLRFELGVENRAEATELVLVIIHCQIVYKTNSGTYLQNVNHYR